MQHINVDKPKKVQLGDSDEEEAKKNEAKIYAISSEGGNIIFHVTSEEKFSGKSEEDLKSFALTTMNKQGSTTTAQSKQMETEELHYERVQPSDVSLTMNPWSSQNSLDKIIYEGFDPPVTRTANLTGAKRLDKETCAKEGISFDDNESSKSSTDDSSTPEDSPEAAVKELLMDVVNRVVPLEMESYNDGEDTDEDVIDGAATYKGGNKKAAGRTGSVTSKSSSLQEDHEILNTVDSKGMEIDSPTASELDLTQAVTKEEPDMTDIHSLHTHMLLYTQKYDYKRTLYALSTLKSMLLTCPRLVVTAFVTTSISGSRTQQLAKLQMLLARHRKSVFGKNFFGDLPPEVMSSYRSNMFIEIIISVCLYFIRSYYPNLMMSKLSIEELQGNKEVHLLGTEVLTLLTSELIVLMKDSGKSFASYIKDLLSRCKLQKALLHCCLASVYNLRKKGGGSDKITEAIVSFNEDDLDPSANETFQVKLLNFLLVMIMLEGHIEKIYGEVSTHEPPTSTAQTADWQRMRVNFHQSLMNAKYVGTSPIVHQRMFLSCLLSALKQSHMRHMHRHWVAMVTSALPYMGKSLSWIVINVVAQICKNLELVAVKYEDPLKTR